MRQRLLIKLKIPHHVPHTLGGQTTTYAKAIHSSNAIVGSISKIESIYSHYKANTRM